MLGIKIYNLKKSYSITYISSYCYNFAPDDAESCGSFAVTLQTLLFDLLLTAESPLLGPSTKFGFLTTTQWKENHQSHTETAVEETIQRG